MFVPRSQTEVVAEMEADLRARTSITDFNTGSNAKGFIETVGTQIAETDFQMAQALDDVSIQSASGTGLDRRAADYGETAVRLPAAPASGYVVVEDDGLVRSELLSLTFVSTTSLSVNPLVRSGTDYFPTSYPYNVRLDEGLVTEEDVIVSNNNQTTDVLTCSATLYAHEAGARVAYVTGAADRTLSTGIVVRRPSTGLLPVADYASTRPGVLVNGNFQSNRIPITAVVAGSNGNCGPLQVSQFALTAPFAGALVTNPGAIGGGRELETDADFRDRILAARQSMSRATKLALRQAVLGVVDASTGKTVASANVVEDLVNDEVLVYVDDGSGSSPATARLATSTVFADTAPGAATLSAPTANGFPAEGWLIVSPEDAAQTELLRYTAVNYTSAPAAFTLVGLTAKTHNAGDEVVLVDMLSTSAEAGQRRFRAQQAPWLPNSKRLWVDSGAGPVLQASGTDYKSNRGNGEVELAEGAAQAAKVALTYSYYTQLLQVAQQKLNGDPLNPTDLPGWDAAGVVTVVAAPTIRRIRVRMSIQALPNSGISEAQLAPLVRSAVEAYIESLPIGADVVVAELIALSQAVPGVFDTQVQQPVASTVILENEVVSPYSASGASLVQVN